MNSRKIQSFCEEYGIDRKQTNCLKWDSLQERFGNKDLLPMWIADMEFKAPKATRQAMIERIEHGVFGYTCIPDSYYEAYFEWQKKRYGVVLKKEWVRFSQGVVQAFYAMIDMFTEKGDSVLFLTPVYYPFFNAVKDQKRHLVTLELDSEKGNYTLDFEEFERKIVEEKVKMFIQCSPHNPVGKVWTKKELTEIARICKKHDVFIVSDEIHQDILKKDVQFTSALNLDSSYFDKLIVLNAPSKTFNLACLLHAHILIPNEQLRDQFDAYANIHLKSEPSLMGVIATEASYRGGAEWLEGLLEVIDANFHYLEKTLALKAPQIVLSNRQGTYLAWLDLSAYVEPKQLKEFIQDKCGLAVDFGSWFSPNTKGFIRLNLATKPEYVQQAVNSIVENLSK